MKVCIGGLGLLWLLLGCFNDSVTVQAVDNPGRLSSAEIGSADTIPKSSQSELVSSHTVHLPMSSSTEFGDEKVIDDYGPVPVDFTNSDGVIAIDLSIKPVQHTEPFSGFEGNRGTDGDPHRYWSSDIENLLPWYQVDLQGMYRLSSVALTARQDKSKPSYRTNVALWVSNDPTFIEYEEIGVIVADDPDKNLTYPQAGVWEVSVQFPESYRYVRVQRIHDAGHFNFGELSVVGELTGNVLIAQAGPTIKVVDTDNNGREKVELNAEASLPGNYSIASYRWELKDSVISNSSTHMQVFPVGKHKVVLTITDELGDKAVDTLVVIVKKGDIFDSTTPFTPIDPWELSKKAGRGINMGNTLEAKNGEGSWAPAAKEYYFDDYQQNGFTNVRIPIHWGIRIDNAGNVDQKFLNRVEEVVDWSLSRGLVTIINTHHEEWAINNYSGSKAKLIRIWEQVAERFKDKPNLLVFELFNEPRAPMTDSDVSDLNTILLKTVRKTNPKRVCIVTGGNWGNWRDLKNVSWPDDPYLWASFHYYEPFNFTHESDYEWSNFGSLWEEMDDIFSWLKNTKGIPGFVGEFGVNHGKMAKDWGSVLKYYATATEAINKWEGAYSVWDDSGWYKVYDRNKRTFNEIEEQLQ
ncbi:MAG: cellulase family glycosylhydrolase [Fibrobacterales bacterium]